MVDAEGVEHGGVEVEDFDFVAGWFFGVGVGGVGLTDDNAAFQPAAADEAGKPVGPMIAAVERIDVWCSAKLSDTQHDRRLEQITLFEIGDETGKGGVENGPVLLVGLEVAGVAVEAPQGDFDGPHALLDQPAGDQTASAEAGVAISGLEPFRFVVQFERLELFGIHHLQRAVDGVLMQRALGLKSSSRLEGAGNDVEVLQPARLTRLADTGPHVADVTARLENFEGIEAVTQVSAAGRPSSAAQRDVLRNLDVRIGKLV